MSRHLSFLETLSYLEQRQSALPVRAVDSAAVLEEGVVFYQKQLDRYPEALRYLEQRGVHDVALRQELRIGYAPGGCLRGHLTALGYPLDVLRRVGLLNPLGRDTFYARVVFPCCQGERIVNLYGRSLGDAFPHRLLPGPKGGLYAWDQVQHCPEVIVVEGLFDYVVLRQAGFHQLTCALGNHLSACQFRQLCDRPRKVYLTFDFDANGSGQQASQRLANRLRVQGIDSRCVLLPNGHDPNSFFVHGGDAQQFQSLLEAAQP